jgi:antitoxin (DNA-binding transcriptional repressor) of toxin-antitoxin stability system
MKRTISAMEARQKFGEILNRVFLLKEEIVIERAGKKIARLIPSDTDTQIKKKSGRLDFRKAAGLGKEIWETINVDQYLNEERQTWE